MENLPDQTGIPRPALPRLAHSFPPLEDNGNAPNKYPLLNKDDLNDGTPSYAHFGPFNRNCLFFARFLDTFLGRSPWIASALEFYFTILLNILFVFLLGTFYADLVPLVCERRGTRREFVNANAIPPLNTLWPFCSNGSIYIFIYVYIFFLYSPQ